MPPLSQHTKLLCGSLGNSKLTYCLSLQCWQEGKQPIMSIRRIYVCLYRSFFQFLFVSHWDFVALYASLYHIVWLSDTRRLANLMLCILPFHFFSQCQFWPDFISFKLLELEIHVIFVSPSPRNLESQLWNWK